MSRDCQVAAGFWQQVGNWAHREPAPHGEKDLEKELDPQMAQIDERLSRIEALLETCSPEICPTSRSRRP